MTIDHGPVSSEGWNTGNSDPFGYSPKRINGRWTTNRSTQSGDGIIHLPDPKSAKMLDPFENFKGDKLLLPTDIPASRKRFSPIVALIMGRRNQGKSFTMTTIANGQWQQYEQAQNGFSIASNYWISFAKYRSQFVMDDIITFPPWAKDLFLCLDEIHQAASSRRSMSREAIGISAFLTMVRKRRIESLFTTQFPQVLDYQVLLQVDLFIEVEQKAEFHKMNLYVHDWWGQWTGSNYRKPWPPRRWDADWVIPLYLPDPTRIFAMYDTDEVIASAYMGREERAALVETEYQKRGWQEQLPMDQAQNHIEEEGLPSRELPDTSALEENLMRSISVGTSDYREVFADAKQAGIVITSNEFMGWLKAHGLGIKQLQNRHVIVSSDDGDL